MLEIEKLKHCLIGKSGLKQIFTDEILSSLEQGAIDAIGTYEAGLFISQPQTTPSEFRKNLTP